MLLKRLYKDVPRDDWQPRTESCVTCAGKGVVVNEEMTGVAPCPAGCERGMLTQLVPPLRGVEVLRGGARQKFSPGLVAQAITEGWMVLTPERITLKAEGGDVVYRIERAPGRYCCHCNTKLADDVESVSVST